MSAVTLTVTLTRVEYRMAYDTDPDLSWLDQGDEMGEGFTDWAEERKASYGDAWWSVGVYVVALDEQGREYRSPGLWGIESDSGRDHFEQVAAEERGELERMLGVSLAELPAEWVEEP